MRVIDSKRNIKLILSYDGTDFCGWQRQGTLQAKDRTVQGTIEAALKKIHKEDIALNGAGRTDTGVHAAAQTANFHTGIESMQSHNFVKALNSILPMDIKILHAGEVKSDFHARFNAKSRTYRYYFINKKDVYPWEERYALALKRNVDIALLNSYARLLRGEMDFSVFAMSEDKEKSTFRYISNAVFFMENDKIIFEITANAFMRKMVRSIAGTFIDFEAKGYKSEYLMEVLASGDRSLAGPTAPPQGLFLWKVDYN